MLQEEMQPLVILLRTEDEKDDVSETRGLKRSAIQDLSSSILKRFKENEEDDLDYKEDEDEFKEDEDEIKNMLRAELNDMDYFETHLEGALNNFASLFFECRQQHWIVRYSNMSRKENEKIRIST